MKKKLLFLFALLMSISSFASTVITDFSGLKTINNGWQQGWEGVYSIMNQVAQAKYLVIETKDAGDNEWGFSGCDLIVQGSNNSAMSFLKSRIKSL